ncbi:MerR family transcriptional regulator OS=Streptomyces alboniger OX=132473 GN=CP975_28875 PE=4 SV=1 [Streptomyces alboniger]
MTPELPNNPEAEQVQAWVELAEISLDPDFRARLRRMAEDQAAEQTRSDMMGPRRDIAAAVRDQAGPALTAGIDPASPQADPIVEAFTAYYAHLLGRPDDVELRRRLATRLESVNDPRRERYLQLLAVVNSWPAPESLAPVFDWSLEALRVRTRQ